MSITLDYTDFELIYQDLTSLMLEAYKIDTGHWQALTDVPQTKTLELLNTTIVTPIPPTAGYWAEQVKPNLPWAESHFQERVGGEPLNPGEQYKNWPWYQGNVETHKQTGQFSHTYMERFWSRDRVGIHHRYGDLTDVVDLIRRHPTTRQAYLPVFFPEDTGAHHNARIPCTLGYHFILRQDELHVVYFIRSCDMYRYLRDDVYMAGRLCQWILEQLRRGDPDWGAVVPGLLTMHITSLHIFEAELARLKREAAVE